MHCANKMVPVFLFRNATFCKNFGKMIQNHLP
jgi:hypothetical protein